MEHRQSAMSKSKCSRNVSRLRERSCRELIYSASYVLGAFVGLDRGSKFSITDILELEANEAASLDAAVEPDAREEEKTKEEEKERKIHFFVD
jgi:hypothetical protein